MIWFVVGAALGVAQLAVAMHRRKVGTEGPVVFLGIGAILGASVYGTILWLLFTYVF